MENKYAPVMIPTLCRYEHLKRCIESLQMNSWAKYTDLYIGLDYPAKESHIDGYNKIREYLESGIEGFSRVIVIKHEKNVGARENSRILRQTIFEKFDNYIYTEDDNEFSSNFLEYMNKCLSLYETDESILAVTGFRYPFNAEPIKGTVFTSNVYFAAFGYGTWKKKLLNAQENMTTELFLSKYNDTKFMKYFYKQGANQYCNFVKGILGYVPGMIVDGKVVPYDLTYGIYMMISGKKMIFPKVSKVRNWGYDGSGVHCGALEYDSCKKITHRNMNFECQELDTDASIEIVRETELSQYEINQLVSSFFEVPNLEILRTKMAYYISRLIGINKMKKLMGIEK